MRDLKLSLLGVLDITVNGKPIEVASNYVRALLLFLAIEKHCPHRREALAEMFWPEKPEGLARNSLKQAISNLRLALGDRDHSDPFLLVSRDEIQFNQSSHYWVDALALTELVEICEEHAHDDWVICKDCENRLLRVVELYRGDFLSDFYLPDNRNFNDWIILKREVFRQQMSDTLCQLALIQEARGEFDDASDYCRQLANLEPWNEENHRNLMRLLALNGMRSAALRQFQTCCENLQDELGVEPSDATVALYEEIQAWEPGNFSNGDPPQISVVKYEQAIHPDEDVSSKPVSIRKLSRRIVAALIIAGFILGIGSVYWLGASHNPSVAIASENKDISPLILATTTSTLVPTPTAAETEESVTSPATVPLPTDTRLPETTLAPASLSSEVLNFEDDLKALIALYESTDGQNWEKADGWLSDRSPCEWYGVICRGDKITELNLAHNHLSGNIPPELGNLTSLTHLILSDNSELSGPIPSELGRLSNLLQLELASEEVGSLLSGQIPPELGNLLNLEILTIQNSLLSGPILKELCHLENLTHLSLGNNQLSGTIYPEFGNLVDLEFLDLGGNAYMSGPIPPEIGKLIRLRYLWLGDGNLSGTLPPEIGNLTRLRILQIDGNPLFGPLPETLTNLNNQQFWFDGTDLCEPADEAFQAWLDGIDDLLSTDVICPP